MVLNEKSNKRTKSHSVKRVRFFVIYWILKWISKKKKPAKTPCLRRFWSYWPDLNRRPADYEWAALPTEPYQHLFNFSLALSLNLRTAFRLRMRCSTNWAISAFIQIFTCFEPKSANSLPFTNQLLFPQKHSRTARLERFALLLVSSPHYARFIIHRMRSQLRPTEPFDKVVKKK